MAKTTNKRKQNIKAKKAGNVAMFGKRLGTNLTRMERIRADESLSPEEKAEKIRKMGGNSVKSAVKVVIGKALRGGKGKKAEAKVKKKQKARSSSRRTAKKAPRRQKRS